MQKSILRWPFQNKHNFNILEGIFYIGFFFLLTLLIVAGFSGVKLVPNLVYVIYAVILMTLEVWKVLSYLDLKKNSTYGYWDEEDAK